MIRLRRGNRLLIIKGKSADEKPEKDDLSSFYLVRITKIIYLEGNSIK